MKPRQIRREGGSVLYPQMTICCHSIVPWSVQRSLKLYYRLSHNRLTHPPQTDRIVALLIYGHLYESDRPWPTSSAHRTQDAKNNNNSSIHRSTNALPPKEEELASQQDKLITLNYKLTIDGCRSLAINHRSSLYRPPVTHNAEWINQSWAKCISLNRQHNSLIR